MNLIETLLKMTRAMPRAPRSRNGIIIVGRKGTVTAKKKHGGLQEVTIWRGLPRSVVRDRERGYPLPHQGAREGARRCRKML